jgi:hypothetical protein
MGALPLIPRLRQVRVARPFSIHERPFAAAEQKLGAVLPWSYRQAMRASNGGQVLACGIVWDLDPNLDASIASAETSLQRYPARDPRRVGSGWPENALAIAGNGTTDKLVLLKVHGRYEPAVYVCVVPRHK